MAETCLQGLNILCDATDADLRQKLHRLISALGGTATTSREATEGVKSSILVADSVLCDAYKATNDKTSKYPRVLPSWLEACQAAGRRVAIKGHELKVFVGLTASITGAYTKEKHTYAEHFVKHGGVYTAEMTRLCTHLIIVKHSEEKESMSVKEMHARAWRDMYIVWDTWMIGAIKRGVYRGDEADHLVPECDDPSYKEFLLINPDLGAAGPNRDDGGAREPPVQTLPGDGPTLGHRATAATKGKALPKAGTASGPEPAKGKGGAAKHSPGSQGQHQAAALEVVENTRSASTGAILSCGDEDDTLFMSGALVHLACCTPGEQLEALRILREGGCTRRPDLRNDVTHVVVGSDLTSAEVQAISEHSKKFGHVSSIVKVEWLRKCLAGRSLLPVAENLTLKASTLALAVAQQKTAATKSVPEKAPPTAKGSQGKATQAGTQRRGCLEGLFFTLAALKVEGEDEQYSRKAIRQAGGRTFDRRTLDLVTAKDKAYAVCPPSLPQPELNRLMQQNVDFRLVPEKNRVTPSWLDVSLDMQKPLAPIPYDRVELQPLPHPIPYPGMAGVKLTASNLTPEEKDSVKRVVNILGGQYSVKMGFSNTHLIVPYAAGDKYEGAVRYNVQPVTCNWIIDVARAGKLLPESRYKPPPFEGGVPPEQSQFPFEAGLIATKDPAKPSQAAGKAPSLMRQVMASSQQHNERASQYGGRGHPKPGLGASRTRQGPSKLDALFSQLHTPVKGLRVPQAAHAAPAVSQPPPASQAENRRKTGDQPQEEASVRVEDEDDDMRDGPGGEAQARGLNVGSAEEMFDILEDVERLGGALAELPHQLSPASQQDPLIPYHKARMPDPSASSDGMASRGDSQDGKSRLKRSTRRGDSVSEDSHPLRAKRNRSLPRHPRANSENLPAEIPQSQACSQEVGYEGVIKAGHPYAFAPGRDLRSSRTVRSSGSTGRSLE